MASTPPQGAISIPVGGNPQAIIERQPAGTAFIISTGQHDGFSAAPKSDDAFYAQPGAVLDGDEATGSAFTAFSRNGQANNVTIVGASANQLLTIQNYTDDQLAQTATIQTQGRGKVWATGWRVQWVQITNSYSRSITTSNDMVIAGCYIHDSGRLGIGGNGSNVVIEGSTINHNGFNVVPGVLDEAGGIKSVAKHLTIFDNTIENNDAPGLWTDVDATEVDIEGNLIVGNTIGIHIEISHTVDIEFNRIEDTHKDAIMISASDHVTISNNALGDDTGGIVGNQPVRGGKRTRVLDYLIIINNSIVSSGPSDIVRLPVGSIVKLEHNSFVRSRPFQQR